jgi:glycosyltransferase involved in cell wall biosynthesis
LKVALIHDWLTGMRGGEKCLEVFCELFPRATLFTLVHIRGSVSKQIETMDIRTSFIQNLPMVKKNYRKYLPLFPAAVEQFDLREYDLVLSSSHCVAKGAIPHAGGYHVCYCHTPMRYVWTMYEEYFGKGRVRGISRRLIPFFAHYLRMWDNASNDRVDAFVANSEHVKKRILRYYGRQADVIYPPVDTSRSVLTESDDGYFLIVSAFAPYKRVDLAIEAFNRLGERLVVIGTGQDEKRLKRLARTNIEFPGWVKAENLGTYYAGCRALLFPGEEDFGIVPVEAQSYGKPVIAYGHGGVLETVKGRWESSFSKKPSTKSTGIFFESQTVESVIAAVKQFNRCEFDPRFIRNHAMQFDKTVFKTKIHKYIQEKMSGRKPYEK